MTGSSHVDATPCFLPLFLLFGGLAGSRAAAGPRAYGRYPLQQGYPRVPGYPLPAAQLAMAHQVGRVITPLGSFTRVA